MLFPRHDCATAIGQPSCGQTQGEEGARGQAQEGAWKTGDGSHWERTTPHKRVMFAEELAVCREFPVEGVEGFVNPDPCLASAMSLALLLEALLDSGCEVEPGLMRGQTDMFLHKCLQGLPPPDLTGDLREHDNLFLGVCVTCPPWATEHLMVSLPILLCQALPHVGHVRIYLLLPEAGGISTWVTLNCEFAIRLSLFKMFDTRSQRYHDSCWRNEIANVAIADGATVVRSLDVRLPRFSALALCALTGARYFPPRGGNATMGGELHPREGTASTGRGSLPVGSKPPWKGNSLPMEAMSSRGRHSFPVGAMPPLGGNSLPCSQCIHHPQTTTPDPTHPPTPLERGSPPPVGRPSPENKDWSVDGRQL